MHFIVPAPPRFAAVSMFEELSGSPTLWVDQTIPDLDSFELYPAGDIFPHHFDHTANGYQQIQLDPPELGSPSHQDLTSEIPDAVAQGGDVPNMVDESC